MSHALNGEKGCGRVQGLASSVIISLDTWKTWAAAWLERSLMSDAIPEGDNIVDDRPANDKRILRTHLFLCHFTETGASPHFTQMYLLFQLQAGRRPAIQIMNFLGHILTTMPAAFVRATILSCRYSNTSSPPKLNVWGCGGSVGKFCKWILVLVAPLVGNVFH